MFRARPEFLEKFEKYLDQPQPVVQDSGKVKKNKHFLRDTASITRNENDLLTLAAWMRATDHEIDWHQVLKDHPRSSHWLYRKRRDYPTKFLIMPRRIDDPSKLVRFRKPIKKSKNADGGFTTDGGPATGAEETGDEQVGNDGEESSPPEDIVVPGRISRLSPPPPGRGAPRGRAAMRSRARQHRPPRTPSPDEGFVDDDGEDDVGIPVTQAASRGGRRGGRAGRHELGLVRVNVRDSPYIPDPNEDDEAAAGLAAQARRGFVRSRATAVPRRPVQILLDLEEKADEVKALAEPGELFVEFVAVSGPVGTPSRANEFTTFHVIKLDDREKFDNIKEVENLISWTDFVNFKQKSVHAKIFTAADGANLFKLGEGLIKLLDIEKPKPTNIADFEASQVAEVLVQQRISMGTNGSPEAMQLYEDFKNPECLTEFLQYEYKKEEVCALDTTIENFSVYNKRGVFDESKINELKEIVTKVNKFKTEGLIDEAFMAKFHKHLNDLCTATLRNMRERHSLPRHFLGTLHECLSKAGIQNPFDKGSYMEKRNAMLDELSNLHDFPRAMAWQQRLMAQDKDLTIMKYVKQEFPGLFADYEHAYDMFVSAKVEYNGKTDQVSAATTEFNKANAENARLKASLDEAKAENTALKAALDKANAEIAGLKAGPAAGSHQPKAPGKRLASEVMDRDGKKRAGHEDVVPDSQDPELDDEEDGDEEEDQEDAGEEEDEEEDEEIPETQQPDETQPKDVMNREQRRLALNAHVMGSRLGTRRSGSPAGSVAGSVAGSERSVRSSSRARKPVVLHDPSQPTGYGTGPGRH